MRYLASTCDIWRLINCVRQLTHSHNPLTQGDLRPFRNHAGESGTAHALRLSYQRANGGLLVEPIKRRRKVAMKRFRIGAVLLLGAIALPLAMFGCGSPQSFGVADAASPAESKRTYANYNASGQLLRPDDHHEWVFVGAPVTPNDMNDGSAAFPEFHNVYIDPASYASYKQTGEFPNGTVILKELVSVGSKAMDSGNGYFQGDFQSLEAMVKDTNRFSDEPGGWAFFRFGEAPHYKPVGARMETDSCNACHSGANEDYVFTDTYPVLRSAKARIAK